MVTSDVTTMQCCVVNCRCYRTRWWMSLLPPSLYYCLGLSLINLIFVTVTLLSLPPSHCVSRQP